MSPVAIPPRPERDLRLDLVRGWLQLSIFASHVGGSFAGAHLIHGAWGLSDSSEQFVFLSGLALGSVFARKRLRDGWGSAVRDMLGRAARLWRTHLAMLVLFGAMILLANHFLPGEADGYGWGLLLRDPVRAVPAALVMLYQPAYLDALSPFILGMALLPLFAWGQARVGAWALLPPGLLWLGVQAGLPAPDLSGDSPPGFNVLAWQFLFLIGAFLGRRVLLFGRAVPPSRALLSAAILIVLLGFAARVAGRLWADWPPVWHVLPYLGVSHDAKAALAPARLLHALALALLDARLVPARATWMEGAAGRMLAVVGRHSLYVFCFGLFLSWGATTALRLLPGQAAWLDPALIATGAALLVVYARTLDRPRLLAALLFRVRPVSCPTAGFASSRASKYRLCTRGDNNS